MYCRMMKHVHVLSYDETCPCTIIWWNMSMYCHMMKHICYICRYSWNGVPLLLRNLEKTSIPRCSNCGTLCAFEMQLMPGLVSLLKTPTGESKQPHIWISNFIHRLMQVVITSDSSCGMYMYLLVHSIPKTASNTIIWLISTWICLR